MRLSYCIHLGFGQKFLSQVGIEPGFVSIYVVYSTGLPLDQSAYFIYYIKGNVCVFVCSL